MEGYEELYDIPQFGSWVEVRTLSGGWSDDRKYKIRNRQGELLLLRTADISQYDRKREEFQWIQRVAATGIPMPKVIDFGVCNSARDTYILLSWIGGAELRSRIGGFSAEEAYRLGIEAGRILKNIHSLAAPPEEEEWQTRMHGIFHRKMEACRHCSLKVEHDGKFMDFIDRSFHLLHEAPQTFLHGDFHPGNLVIDDGGALSVIDFNRFEFGDPVRDFARLAVFSCRDSADFARGQIDGYFEGAVPDYFFPRLAFYAAFDSLFCLVWAERFGQDEVDAARIRISMVYDDFAGFTESVPGWYHTP